MADFQQVKRWVTRTAKKELVPIRVVKVNMREGETSIDREPAYRIDIVFEGDRLDPRKVSNMLLAIKAHFWDIKEARVPMYGFLKPEDEESYYAPRDY